jgi:hypothetical protein
VSAFFKRDALTFNFAVIGGVRPGIGMRLAAVQISGDQLLPASKPDLPAFPGKGDLAR